MADNFVVPSDPEELLGRSSTGAYSVTEEFDPCAISASALLAKVDEFSSAISEDPIQIICKFDVGFSLTRKFSKVSSVEAKRVVMGALCEAAINIHKAAETAVVSGDNHAEVRCAIKMIAYLMHLMIVAADDTANSARTASGKSTKKGAAMRDDWDWSTRRSGCIDAYAHLITPPISQLWPSGNPSPEFVNLFMKVGFKLLEDSTVARDNDARRPVFALLGSAIKRFSQAFGATTSILHLLGHFEHLPGPLADLVVYLVQNWDGQAVVNEIMHEIGRIDPREYAQDTASARNIATFLSDLTEADPAAVLRSSGVSVLLPHLDGESYTIRNAILSMLTSLVCHLIRSEDPSLDDAAAAKTRTQFQEILEERIHDVSAYVRAKALQMWARMVSVEVQSPLIDGANGDTERRTGFRSAIPRHRLPVLVALAANRLKDKSSLVRKDAIRLMTILLTRNPYGAELKQSQWRSNYEAEAKTLDAMQPCKSTQNSSDTSSESQNPEANEDTSNAEVSDTNDDDVLLNDDEAAPKKEESNESSEISPELAMQALKVTFYKEATFFIEQMENVIPCASDLLGSSNVTDMKESIAFLETCQRFGFETAGSGIRKMLALIWSKEESVRGTLIDTYTRLYLSNSRAETVAKNLVALTEGCNLGELTSLEELVIKLKENCMISDSVINKLWAMFAMRGNATRDQSVRALIILSMVARADPEIVRGQSGQLVSIGFGDRGRDDMALVRYTCKAVQVLVPPSSKHSKGPVQLFESSDSLFTRMADVIVTDRGEEIDGWYAAAEEVVNTVYLMSEIPDKLCKEVIDRLSKVVKAANGHPTAAQLARLVAFVGHVALKQLVHLEKIERELKRRARIIEDTEQKKKKEKEGEAENIVGGAAATDVIAEDIARIAEHTLVRGDTLLAQFGPLLVAICKNPGRFGDAGLRSAAVLALSKFMCVSQTFAEEHLQLFFTIMQESPEPRIRANCVLAVGDLAFRFANLLEPWTGHMYSRLRDDNVTVRKNAVMVLTHLILNDMIKIKGNISEMAVRLEDSDSRVSSLAHLFFHELARKGNAIYNMLPDVISQLACGDSRIDAEQFKKITAYLFSFITKGVHCVSLVEKLCYRFRTTQDVVQWRYFAHCLTLLPYNDKCVKKLQSQMACFQATLADPEIYDCFVTIISKAKKFASTDMKDAVSEFEEKIAEIHSKGAEDDAAAQKALQASKKVAKVKAKKRANKDKSKNKSGTSNRRRERRAKQIKSDEESENADEENIEPNKLSSHTSNAASTKRRVVLSDEDDEDDFLI